MNLGPQTLLKAIQQLKELDEIVEIIIIIITMTNKYSDVFLMDKDEFLHLLTDGPKHNVARFRPLDLNFSR